MATIRMKKGSKYADIFDSPETIRQAQMEGYSIGEEKKEPAKEQKAEPVKEQKSEPTAESEEQPKKGKR